jgi:protein SCO1/2
MIVILKSILTQERQLPIYTPTQVNPKLVDASLLNSRGKHQISDFNLINQYGKKVTDQDFENSIYVANFFFTRCKTICPVMTSNMLKIQDAFVDIDEVKLLSHSVTPRIDSVPVLRAYAEKHKAIEGKWQITTGYKKHIYDLARKSYFAVLDVGDGGLQDFIHTENFVLIDKKKQIRGYYNGIDQQDIARLIEDVALLLKQQKEI